MRPQACLERSADRPTLVTERMRDCCVQKKEAESKLGSGSSRRGAATERYACKPGLLDQVILYATF